MKALGLNINDPRHEGHYRAMRVCSWNDSIHKL